MAPAASGITTCPSRFPVNRSDRAEARLDGFTRPATHVMVNGCASPQKNPAIETRMPTAQGWGSTGTRTIGSAEHRLPDTRSQFRGATASRRVSRVRETIAATDRAVRMTVTTSTL